MRKKLFAVLLTTALLLSAIAVRGIVPAVADRDESAPLQGLVREDDGRVRFYVDGEPVAAGLQADREGNLYYIPTAHGAVPGYFAISEANTNGLMPAGFYQFDMTTRRMIIKNGIYTDDLFGRTYYYEHSISVAAGLMSDNAGHIYFFTNIYGTKRAATDGDYYVPSDMTNGLMEEGTYRFDENGYLIGKSDIDLKPVPPVVVVPGEGLCFDADGRVRFYVDGVSVAAGLQADRKGNLYYIPTAHGAVAGYFAVSEANANGLMPAGFYEFDSATRRMIIKNGIYTNDWLDKTYFFVNSIPQAAGLMVDVDGHIYYFTNVYGTNRAITDADCYVTAKDTNGLMPAGLYHFNENGYLTSEIEVPTEPATVPVTEPATIPVTEPTTEPATLPVPQPATEPATLPVPQPATESADTSAQFTDRSTSPTPDPIPSADTSPATTKPVSGGCKSGVCASLLLLIPTAYLCLSRKRKQ